MSAQTKVSGTWRNMVAPHVKVAGSWKAAKSAWTKVNGQWKSWFLQGGLVDSTFLSNIGTGFNNRVLSVDFQADGKILVGGSFTSFNGTTASRLIRLNLDGTVDTTFLTNIGTGAGLYNVWGVKVQPDGKILIGGDFSSFNGTSVPSIARLNSNGTIDTAFMTNIGTGVPSGWAAYTFFIDSNNKILVGGAFPSFNGTNISGLVVLNQNGTVDTEAVANIGSGASNRVNRIIKQTTGKIILGGSFTTFSGISASGIARLNTNFSVDAGFTANTGSGPDNGIAPQFGVQPDNKIVVGGGFSTFNGQGANRRIVRLSADGVFDSGFDATIVSEFGGGVNQLKTLDVAPNGEILFTAFRAFTGSKVMQRLSPDGVRDLAFINNVGSGHESTLFDTSFWFQPDGKILVAGNYTSFNGTTTGRIIRIGGEAAF